MHPKVQSGEMTEAEVFAQFLQNFGDKNKDGKVDRGVIIINNNNNIMNCYFHILVHIFYRSGLTIMQQ